MTVWWLAIDANGRNGTYDNLQHRQVIAQGWSELGDLTAFIAENVGNPQDEIVQNLENLYEQHELNNNDAYSSNTPTRMYNFLFEIGPGDIVVGIEGVQVMGVCLIPENIRYKYQAPQDMPLYNGLPIYMEYAQTRGPVEWHGWNQIQDATGQAPPVAPAQGVQMIARMQNQAAVVENAFRRFLQQREIQ